MSFPPRFCFSGGANNKAQLNNDYVNLNNIKIKLNIIQI